MTLPICRDRMGLITRLFGFLLIGVGFVVFWLPIPLGLIMMLMGGMLVFGKNRRMLARMRLIRYRNPSLDRRLRWLVEILPGFMTQILVDSSPNGKRNPAS